SLGEGHDLTRDRRPLVRGGVGATLRGSVGLDEHVARRIVAPGPRIISAGLRVGMPRAQENAGNNGQGEDAQPDRRRHMPGKKDASRRRQDGSSSPLLSSRKCRPDNCAGTILASSSGATYGTEKHMTVQMDFQFRWRGGRMEGRDEPGSR